MRYATHLIDVSTDPDTVLTAQQIIAAANGMTGSEIVSAINSQLGSTDWQDVNTGPAGENGADGAPGADGADGAPGADGSDGVGIADVEIDGSGHLIVTLTDLSEIDAGALPTGVSEYGGASALPTQPRYLGRVTGTSWTDLPAWLQPGDLIFALQFSAVDDEASPIAAPWTTVANLRNLVVDVIEYAGTESGAFPVSLSGADVGVFAVRGSSISQMDYVASSSIGPTTETAFPSLSSVVPGSLLLGIAYATEPALIDNPRWDRLRLSPDITDLVGSAVHIYLRTAPLWRTSYSGELVYPATATGDEDLVTIACGPLVVLS